MTFTFLQNGFYKYSTFFILPTVHTRSLSSSMVFFPPSIPLIPVCASWISVLACFRYSLTVKKKQKLSSRRKSKEPLFHQAFFLADVFVRFVVEYGTIAGTPCTTEIRHRYDKQRPYLYSELDLNPKHTCTAVCVEGLF